MAEHLIALTDIARFREGKPVLRSISLTVSPGELHIVLGANGAGKSTLLRIMAGLLRPSSGEIRRNENTVAAYLGHPTFLYGGLTAMQNLRFQAHINRIKSSDDALRGLLDQVGLDAHAHTRAGAFSRGMAQRLNFCRVLLLKPQLLLLDEPFTGLDIPSRRVIREELRALRESGRGIVLVSHDPEADAVLASHCHELVSGRLNTKEFPPC